MKLSGNELLAMLDKQREIEVKVANDLKETMDKTDNKLVKLLLRVIRTDTLKHADVLEALKDIAGKRGMFAYVEKEEVKRALEKHIRDEQKMLDRISDIARNVGEERVKFIVEGILGEERRHHASLKQLYEYVESVREVSEEELWDYLNRWANFST